MKTLRPKIAIIGAGNVGVTFAFALIINGLAREIVLIDKNQKRADGDCMDLNHGLSFAQPALIYNAELDGCRNSDMIVISAGANQKPGQTRIDLVRENVEVFKQIIPKVVKYAPNAVIIVVTNPVDILTYVALKISGLPERQVIGSGTALDTARLRYLISSHCQLDTRNVHAYIIGEHGDTEVAVWSNAQIAGMKLEKACPICMHECEYEKELSRIFEQVRDAAYKIIEAKGATYYAVALALVKISEVILRDENSILPVSTLINDYYGIDDVCISLPCLLNKSGVVRYIPIELSEIEQKQFRHSAQTLKDILKQIQL